MLYIASNDIVVSTSNYDVQVNHGEAGFANSFTARNVRATRRQKLNYLNDSAAGSSYIRRDPDSGYSDRCRRLRLPRPMYC